MRAVTSLGATVGIVAACVVAAGAGIAISCKRADDTKAEGPNAGGFDKNALLKAMGQCTLDTYKEMAAAASALDAEAKRAKSDPAALPAARESWRKAMAVWERAELFTYGPAGVSGGNGTPGGKDLRDPIYSWPLFSRCLVDEAIVSQKYATAELASGLVSTRSLAALEYLLFYDGAENGCPAENAINAQGTWKAIPKADLDKRRATYARVVAADVGVRVAQLVDAWEPGKGAFLDVIANAGKNDVYKAPQTAFNAVSDALFYVDIPMKTMKVGRPAGLTAECAAPPCLDMVESPFAHASKDHLRQNLVGIEKMMRGCQNGDGLGFDDYLVAVGAEATAKKMADAIVAARAALDGLVEPTFEQDLQKNAPGVKVLFEALRTIINIMKTEMASVLDLELPKAVQGDND